MSQNGINNKEGQTPSDTYLAYKKSLLTFESLPDEDLEGEVAKQIIEEFKTIAIAYASSPFGFRKIETLRKEIHSEEWAKNQTEENKQKTKSERRQLSILVDKHPKNVALEEIISIVAFGKNQVKDSRVYSPSLNNVPLEIATALENQELSLAHFIRALKIHQALGADIPIIDGSVLWHCFFIKGRWEDTVKKTIGYFSSKKMAYLAIANLIFKKSEGATHETPWGILDNIDDPTEWNSKRLEWFSQATFQDMIDWYCKVEKIDEFDFYIKKHQVASMPLGTFEPKGLMDVDLEEEN